MITEAQKDIVDKLKKSLIELSSLLKVAGEESVNVEISSRGGSLYYTVKSEPITFLNSDQ